MPHPGRPTAPQPGRPAKPHPPPRKAPPPILIPPPWTVALLNPDASLQYLSIYACSLCTLDACNGHPLCQLVQLRRIHYSMHEGAPHEDNDYNIDVRGAAHLACSRPIWVWRLAIT